MKHLARINDYKKKHPFFVIGTGRCGTTLLAKILNTSSDSTCYHQKTKMTYDDIINAYHFEENSNATRKIISNLKKEMEFIEQNSKIYGESSNHLFFLPNHISFDREFEPFYIFLIREPISFIKSALARGFYDEKHPHPFMNALLPKDSDPISKVWNKLTPEFKCLWYWMAKNDYTLVNLAKNVSEKRWRIILFENIADQSVYEQLFSFLELSDYNNCKEKINQLLTMKVNATPTINNFNIHSTNPKSVTGKKFNIEDIDINLRGYFKKLLNTSITYQALYNKAVNEELEIYPLKIRNIKKLILTSGEYYENKKKFTKFRNIDEKKIGFAESNDIIYNLSENEREKRDYQEIKDKGLIGERDTPLNPEFIKSGYSKIMFHRYEMCLPFCKEKNVLDVGCGLGWGADIISNAAKCVYAIDYDNEAINYCKRKYPKKNLHFVNMVCDNIAYENKMFDIVLLMEVIEHLHLYQGTKCISQIADVLKHDGMLIGSTYIPENENLKEKHMKSHDNEHHLHIYTLDEMKSLLSSYFKEYKIIDSSYFIAKNPIEKIN